MEKAIPGENIKMLFPENDNKAIEIASNVILKIKSRKLYESDNIKFTHINELFKILDNDWPSDNDILIKAKKMRDEITNLGYDDFLLHGDLHHENILTHNGVLFNLYWLLYGLMKMV